ncbi:chloramphenicol O-acetyltransferase type A [Neolewinella xylanilytica]|uniref:Chloramphenicol O-acetyltransferase type A n=1 Tax=Neolewinella xylanilytica TaxID=1514080 RepID=A0A2S6I411_9BACT|nr:chloramphenicol acetyltransferase [Neolewinella xylanilytica]PPK85799.1 chloramphenicol O-acetyltransferase type A [Neolewinella xylanilytica]
MRFLDLPTWNRREHFAFFRQFEEPFFGLTVRVDCTEAYARSKQTGHSFFQWYLHKVLVSVNEVEAFRYRIRDDRVVIHDRIHASATINREDGTFDFSYIPFVPEFTDFAVGARREIDRIRTTSGLNVGVAGDDVIHFSAAPWLDFTALSHARQYRHPDSCPKISVGKVTERDGRLGMPVSIHAHHALMDGREVGAFVLRLEEQLREK